MVGLPDLRIATDDGLRVLGDAGDRLELAGRTIHALEERAGERWALVDDTELWRQVGSGEWERLATSDALELTCLLPLDDGVLVGTEEAHLMRWGGGELEIVASFEFAEGRDEWFTPWGGPPDVRSMALGADGAPLVNVHVGGILRSEDDGTRWSTTIDLHADVHEVVVVPERTRGGTGGWLLAATAEGLAVSKDGGESWSLDTDGLHASYCRAVALAGDAVLVSASDGPFSQRAALYRRPLAGEGLTRCEAGLPEWFEDNIDTRCVAGSGALAAFGTADGHLYLSADAGLSWRLHRDGLPPIHRVLL